MADERFRRVAASVARQDPEREVRFDRARVRERGRYR
jgi:hypothetical protein